MVAGVLHKVADGAGLWISNRPFIVGPHNISGAVLGKACHGGGQGEPYLIFQRLRCGCVINNSAVWQVNVQVLMRLVVACFQLDQGQLRLAVVQQQVVNLLRADLLCGGGCAKVDAWSLVSATAKKGNALDVDTATLRADHALL